MTIDFDEAVQVQTLRGTLSHCADNAATYGTVSRTWLNEQLAAVGAPLITQGDNTYQIFVPVTGAYGTTVTAPSRAEALERFQRYAARVLEAGELLTGRHGQGIFNLKADESAGGVQFQSGPEDPEAVEAPAMDLETFRAAARKMLMDGISQHGWGVAYANKAADKLGVGPLPTLESRTVQVPVTGKTNITVLVFAEASEEELTSAARAKVAQIGSVMVTPDEVGDVVASEKSDDDEAF